MNALKSFANTDHMASLVNWLILFAGLWLTTNFVWSFWPQVPAQVSETAPTATTPSKTFNLQSVLSVDLFGSPDEAAVEQPEQITAPVTRLNLKLRGVYASEDEYASAMIEHNRQQEVYRIGANLPGAAGLKLYRVLSDRVIMSRNDKYETLYIEDFDGSRPTGTTQITRRQPATTERVVPQTKSLDGPSTGTDRNVIDKTGDAQVTRSLLKLRENMTDPAALSEVISMSPVNDEGGGFQGFRVAPGKNRQLFSQLGLRRNDIVTGVNGIAMTDASSAFTVIEQLQSADEITLSILRGDREMEIKLSAVAQ